MIEQDTPCDSILFVVQGKVQLHMVDEFTGDRYLLDTLQQGDVIGQYSVLFMHPFLFSATAASQVRVLRLSKEVLVAQLC